LKRKEFQFDLDFFILDEFNLTGHQEEAGWLLLVIFQQRYGQLDGCPVAQRKGALYINHHRE